MTEEVKEDDNAGPVGLGGWLILVGIGLLVTPFQLGAMIYMTFMPFFEDGTWALLTTPGSDAYHPLLAYLIAFEMAVNIAFAIASLAVLGFLIAQSRRFPNLFIGLVLANLIFIVLDAWLGSLIITDEPMMDPETTRTLIRSAVFAAIWIPYMRVSRRVRNTFVK